MLGCLSIALLGLLASPSAAQDQTAQIWAVFAYNVNGEIIPEVFPRSRALTTYGANQMHDAGAAFRDRYIALRSDSGEPNTRIENLSPYLLDNEEVTVASTPDAAVLASAQAFMQGLYPPLDESFNASYFEQQLANGLATTAPLGGYQYPSIMTFGLEDPQSLTIAGQARCPLHASANIEYIGSKEFWHTYQESSVFYNHLHAMALSGEFDTSASNYANATRISEFLDYQAVHNESLFHSLSREDVKRARWFAGKFVYETNGNTSSGNVVDGSIRTIAGQGLASSVLNAFETNIQARGVGGKMTLKFGGYETAVSFASLLGLAHERTSNFYSLPNLSASVILELFSLESENYPTFPDPSDLYVRFLLRNGTNASFVPYPLFGHSPSITSIPFRDFQSEMQRITLGSTADWCRRCNSSAVFCSGVVKPARTGANRKDRDGLNPAVAGVIGAVVTISLFGLLAVCGFLTYFQRIKRRRKPSLGGFKGDRKMASDLDVAFKSPQWGDGIKHPEASARGYERHGSWEMDDHKSPPRLVSQNMESSFADEIEEDWRLHSGLEGVKVREHV
ncbi:histidine phosphatase superfamily [Aspergillus egyptiacus]|nr:histidine phosphatase superfamily [Aspergillus egyptiacus]